MKFYLIKFIKIKMRSASMFTPDIYAEILEEKKLED